MMNLLKQALFNNASSKTRKYFLNSSDGEVSLRDYLHTMEVLITAQWSDSIICHNGGVYDQNDYSVIGNISELWKSSVVYACSKDLLRRRNAILSCMKSSDEDTDSDDSKVPFSNDDNETNKSVLTPLECSLFIQAYNEQQSDFNKISVSKLEGIKGISYYDLQGFKSGNSIVQGNENGTYAPEVSVCLSYTNKLTESASIIDEVNERALEVWLLAKKDLNQSKENGTP